jgi:hypothetical protein
MYMPAGQGQILASAGVARSARLLGWAGRLYCTGELRREKKHGSKTRYTRQEAALRRACGQCASHIPLGQPALRTSHAIKEHCKRKYDLT